MSIKYDEKSLAAAIEAHEANFKEAYGQNVHLEMMHSLHNDMVCTFLYKIMLSVFTYIQCPKDNLIKHLKKEQPELLKHMSIGSTGLLIKILKEYIICHKASNLKPL